MRELVAQELLLFENSGSDDLEDVVDSRFQLGRFTMKLPFVDAIQYGPFTDGYLKRFYREGVPGYPSILRAVRAARFLVERNEILTVKGGDRQ